MSGTGECYRFSTVPDEFIGSNRDRYTIDPISPSRAMDPGHDAGEASDDEAWTDDDDDRTNYDYEIYSKPIL